MPDRSLRRTILFYASTLLVLLIVAMLAFVNYRANSYVSEQIDQDIRQGTETIATAEAAHIETLRAAARALASYPPLFAQFADPDLDTLLSALSGLKAEETDLLIVLNSKGQLIARTDRQDTAPIEPIGKSAEGVLATEEGVFHFAAALADTTGQVEGTVVAAAKIDKEFAAALRRISRSDVVLVGDRVLGTSPGSEDQLPWQTRTDWDAAVRTDGMSHTIDVNGETYIARSSLLGRAGGIRPLAIAMQSQDKAMQPYWDMQYGLLILGLIAAGAGIAGSAYLARRVTAPIAELVEGTQQVAAGNFDHRIDIDSRDEIGDLAQSFNTMIKGLRERADMQKFVSQSTVDMIQSTSAKEVKAGERVTLTILFSDMRGFTSMADRLPPEETVRILNSCLSLQAARVKKFGGDIDKFVGDCVVALFDGEDKELHAIRCAVEIHRALDGRNAGSSDVEPVHVGIGIATGEVILGSIGSEDRLDYTVIGSHVNLCSRICSLAGPRETWMSQSTYDRVEGLVAAERLDPVRVKGFAEPVPLYRMKPTPLLA